MRNVMGDGVAVVAALSFFAASDTRAQIPDTEFVRIQPGTFQMGSTLGDDHQRPVHAVTLTRGYLLQKTRVSQAQWVAVMGTNPSIRKNCIQCPIDNVSYDDVQRFIAALNGRSTTKYRLPTEAEWEYAARAGSEAPRNELAALTQGGFIADYATGATQPVGTVPTNGRGVDGIRDLEGNSSPGNVWEWVADWYGPFPAGAVSDPVGSGSGDVRVIRGGAFQVSAAFPGAKCRQAVLPSKTCVARLSFRLVKID
jgi:formylglycine-generating enzyme required for sulfatase activity